MRVIDPKIMHQVFAVTDEMPLSREAIQVPLVMQGEGKVERLKTGRFEITLPDTDDLGPFLSGLAERLLGAGAVPEAEP